MHLAYNDNKQLIVQGLYYTYLSSSEIGNCLNLDQLKSTRSNYIGVIQWRCSRGGGGADCPPEGFHREIQKFTGKNERRGKKKEKGREKGKGVAGGGGISHVTCIFCVLMRGL